MREREIRGERGRERKREKKREKEREREREREREGEGGFMWVNQQYVAK